MPSIVSPPLTGNVRTLSSTNRPLSATVKWFFDRARLDDYIEKRHRRAMNRIGGWMRRYMQQSMRRSTSQQPHSVAGRGRYSAPRASWGLLRGRRSGGGPGIFYSYDPQIRGVVVGPTRINTNPWVRPQGKTVPQLLNEGGRAVMTGNQRLIKRRGSRQLISPYSRGGRILNRRIARNTASVRGQYYYVTVRPGPANYPARPFARPALEAVRRENRLRWAFRSLY